MDHIAMPNNRKRIRAKFGKKIGSKSAVLFRRRESAWPAGRWLSERWSKSGWREPVRRPVQRGLIYSASPRGHRDSSLNAETRNDPRGGPMDRRRDALFLELRHAMGKKIWKWPWQDNELNCARYARRRKMDGWSWEQVIKKYSNRPLSV